MTEPLTVQLFVNPQAGARSHPGAIALSSALENMGAHIIVTESSSDFLKIDPRADHACAVGGDGTLRHVVDAVRRAGRAVPLSTFPAGTINLVARECGYAADAEALARRIVASGRPRDHHIALIDEIPLLVCASVGPDSRAVHGLSPGLKQLIGRAAYVVAFLVQMTRWDRAKIILIHDGGSIDCEAVYIAKGRFFAGPWSFAPKARLTEPMLHVIALRDASRLDFLKFLWAMFRSRPMEHLAGVHHFSCTALTIRSDVPLPMQADGDIVAHLPVSIRIEAKPVRFA